MSLTLKRKENLRKGLQRVAEQRLQEVLQAVGKEGLTAEAVHNARKAIKSLRATLRLTRGALSTGVRQERNQALRDFAGRLSGPRDAAVTLAAFEKAYGNSLDGDHRPKTKPRWATQTRQALESQAHAPVKAETFQAAAEEVRRLAGRLLPLQDARHGDHPPGTGRKDEWDTTVGEGLRKTYRQGRRLLAKVEATPDAPDEEWHELRKRAKDLGYQLALLTKLKGVKALLASVDEIGTALGDARDLSLLRGQLGKVQDKRELTPAERRSYQRLLSYVEQQRQELHQCALQTARRVYRRGSKKFAAQVAKRWRQWGRG